MSDNNNYVHCKLKLFLINDEISVQLIAASAMALNFYTGIHNDLTLFDIGGMINLGWPHKMFLITVLKRLGGGR